MKEAMTLSALVLVCLQYRYKLKIHLVKREKKIKVSLRGKHLDLTLFSFGSTTWIQIKKAFSKKKRKNSKLEGQLTLFY